MNYPMEKFPSNKYLIIKNDFFRASTSMCVSREDLMSILQHFDSIEKYRFHDQTEYIAHWTIAYAKFKDGRSAEQAKRILTSVNFITVEYLPDVLNYYDIIEDELRISNPVCDQGTCITVEPALSEFTTQDLYQKFHIYGSIIYAVHYPNHLMIWFRRFSEAYSAEIDNNKWNNDSRYFTVKIYDQVKELSMRMVNINISSNEYKYEEGNYEEYDDFLDVNDENYSSTDANESCVSYSEMPTGTISVENKEVDIIPNGSIVSNNIKTIIPEDKRTSNAIENVSFNPKDYTFYLQIIKKNQVEPSSGSDLKGSSKVPTLKSDFKAASGIAIEIGADELIGYTEGFINELSSEIQQSLSSKFTNLKIDDSESEDIPYQENIPRSSHSNSPDLEEDNFSTTLESSVSDINEDHHLPNCNDDEQRFEQTNLHYHHNTENDNLPFYRYTPTYPLFLQDSTPYNDYTYCCPCCGSWTNATTPTPWNVVPNVFIVPTTSFGRRTFFKNYSAPKGPTENDASIKVPEFDDNNFPPLGTEYKNIKKHSKSNSKVNINKIGSNDKEFKDKKIIGKNSSPMTKKPILKKGKSSRIEILYPVEHASKSRSRKRRPKSQKSIPQKKYFHTSNQNRSTSSSEDRNNAILKCELHRKSDVNKSEKSNIFKASASTVNIVNSGIDSSKQYKCKRSF